MTILPQNLLTTQHTLLESFETIGQFTVSASSTMAADTTNFMQGTQSIQCTGLAGSQAYINKDYTASPLDLSGMGCLRIYFYVADVTKINAWALLLSHSSANYTNGFQLSAGVGAIRTGWNFKNILKSDFSKLGTGSWANTILQVRFRFTSVAAQVGVVSWDNMTAGVLGTPVASIGFDDGYVSVYNIAYPILKAHGLRATVNITSGNIDLSSAWMSTAQLAELYANGWDITDHTDTSTDLTTLNQADAQTAITNCKTVIDAKGWTRADTHLVYPSGGYNATVKAATVAAGMLSGRMTAQSGPEYEILPFEDQFVINPYSSLNSTRSVTTLESKVDQAKAKGGVLVVYGHDIVTGTPVGEQWNNADFKSLVDYIVAQGILFVTMSDLILLQSGPVTVPDPVTAPDPGVSMIAVGGGFPAKELRRPRPRTIVPDVIRSPNYNNLIGYEDEEITLLL